MDDKSKRGPADRSRVNIHEPYELEYWATAFGVSRERLKQLVAQYGTSVAAIRRALGQ